jgi:cytoplasmic iron level regulating protein YaaA (DUF328/UPF0246 family)
MPRINEHKFSLENSDYKLTFYRNEKPIVYINEKIHIGNKTELLKKYIVFLGLGLNLDKLTTQQLSDIVLKHFSDNTIKIPTISESIKLEAKPTLIYTTSDFSNSTDVISTSNKNILYLIPCSSSKISKEELENKPFNIDRLEFNNELGKFRKELIDKLKISQLNNTHKRAKQVTKNKIPQIEIRNIINEFNFNQTAQAHRLYSKGKLYHSNSSDSINWTQTGKEKIYIVSALFGIIRADNYIPLYDFAMKDELDKVKNFAQDFWNGKLDVIIKNLINNGYIIYNLLSNDYNSSVSKEVINLTVIPDVKYKASDASEKRGKWLNRDLNI